MMKTWIDMMQNMEDRAVAGESIIDDNIRQTEMSILEITDTWQMIDFGCLLTNLAMNLFLNHDGPIERTDEMLNELCGVLQSTWYNGGIRDLAVLRRSEEAMS